MPTLITRYNWGSALRNDNPQLVRQLDEAYTDIALVVNTKTAKLITTIDPPNAATADSTNKNFDIGDFWVNTASDSSWMMTSRTSDVLVTWTLIT